MKWPLKFWLAVLVIILVAGILRLWRLDNRPMHGDEAIHAYKFGRLLERNEYRYDPGDFHGPTLNYFTLIPALLSGKGIYASLTESTMRIVPVVFGLLLVVMPLLLVGGLGRPVSLIAAGLTAISPAFVFYSRYYIQEMLLVCFTFGVMCTGYKYVRSRKLIWALSAGLFAGLCHATKETCIIAFGSMLVALLARRYIFTAEHAETDEKENRLKSAFSAVSAVHLAVAVVLAFCVSALFYSSFLTNPDGVLDSFRAYAAFFSRAGANQHHIEPWYYYLRTLIFSKSEMGPPWTEGFVVILAGIGGVLIIARKGLGNLDRRLLDFLLFYTAVMLVVYSAIPYKTPWCLLGFYHGMILLGAVGVVAIIGLIERMLARLVVGAFFVLVAVDLATQAFTASFISYTDPSSPYVYSQPTKDVVKIAERIKNVLPPDSTGFEPVWVVCPGGDYWPLPWYLRGFKNVGWWNDVNEITQPAPVVIASAELEDRLINRLYEISPAGEKNLYVPLFETYIELRPGVEIRGYITKDLSDKLLESNNER
ncbi:MAG: TIGR03663 family protein [Sedimentisphaerales bacterium]|nr:TIGR03663 family protein [Sedimentisphaerales bacterium]